MVAMVAMCLSGQVATVISTTVRTQAFCARCSTLTKPAADTIFAIRIIPMLVREPVAEAVSEPVTEAVSEPVTETVSEPVAESVPEPVVESESNVDGAADEADDAEEGAEATGASGDDKKKKKNKKKKGGK